MFQVRADVPVEDAPSSGLAAIHLGRLWRSGATRPGREAFVKNAQDMTVNLAYVGPVEFGKMMAADHDRYAKLVQGVKK